jgi:hypothetical protein
MNLFLNTYDTVIVYEYIVTNLIKIITWDFNRKSNGKVLGRQIEAQKFAVMEKKKKKRSLPPTLPTHLPTSTV